MRSPNYDVINLVGSPQRKTSTSVFSMIKKESSTCLSPFLLLQHHENHDINMKDDEANCIIQQEEEASKYEGE